MLFSNVIGQEFIKKHLTQSADKGRISHAQLFVGNAGSGVLPMAIAYAQYILCKNVSGENTGGEASCNLRLEQLAHPDLHFVYPVTTNNRVKKHPVSSLFIEEWRSFVKQNAYGSLHDWLKHIDAEKKQGIIGVDEVKEISKTLALKSYEGGYKVMIIWMAENINLQASNKLLKLIEEPPEKTLLLLLAESDDTILDTIKSRCQIIHFPKLSVPQIAKALMSNLQATEGNATKIAHQAAGDYNRAVQLYKNTSNDIEFEKWFVKWVRVAFMAKKKKESVIDLMNWSETIAKNSRETQKNFLAFCVRFFRQALLENYSVSELVYVETQTDFDLKKFAPFVNGNNISAIIKALEEASYHIERNGNARIILSDLSLQLTRFIHRK